MNPLDVAFNRCSPRLLPRKAPVFSYLLTFGVTLLWLGLLSRAFASHSLLAWSAGIVYVSYDTLLIILITLTSLPLILHKRPQLHAAPLKNLSVGVIVPAFNEAPVLVRTLKALIQQKSPADKIILADDGSTDNSSQVLEQFLQLNTPKKGELSAASPRFSNIYWLRLPHRGKAHTLNHTLPYLHTDLIVTVDADTRLDQAALQEAKTYFTDHPRVVAATGILTPQCAPHTKGKILELFQRYEYIRNFISRYSFMRVDSLLLISGALAIFKRDSLVCVGGFDPECLVEDYEVIHRLHRFSVEHQQDWHTAVIGSVQGITSSPSTIGSFLKQRRRWFAGFLQTQHWNRDMIGNPKFKLLGLLMMPIKTFDTHQPVYGLSAFTLLLWYVLSGQLSLVLGILSIMLSKVMFDSLYHLWSILLYRRWTGLKHTSPIAYALLSSLLEPFSFQLLRHLGATLGWFHFMTGQRQWGKEKRAHIV
ncbi:MAG: glycosyl transferase [Ferrovum sp. 37-45-19]|nr:MAG: glycosyl transferase [Ferrovum sp. 21-44-67]OYV93697.1 MAG: glycosyl transferase [Ferrovum sp. 37-45-19]OZB31674.1 MAG: glycosyl transferase [Ferrovum sp. 34-44-207]HQT82188.1 glycosyltransferase family 2 protein [Ferrovaceae bacterium]HQU07204.1 glycosyltransferase family 2 protein [Ferrovaceae bacterium]